VAERHSGRPQGDADDVRGADPVQTAYSRVTVLTAGRTIDLALPSALPLADVLPQVMRYAAPDASANGGPTSWTLARIGGASMSLAHTLAEAGVVDGEVLELRPETDEVRPAVVEDVRDAVEDSVDAAGGVWDTPTTRSFTILVGSAVLGLLALLAVGSDQLGRGSWAELLSPASALTAVVVLLLGTWWSAQQRRDGDAQVAAAVALVWAALLGASLGAGADLAPHLALGLGAVLVTVAAGVARLLTPAATGHLAVAAVLLLAGVVAAVAEGTALPADQVRRVLPVLAVLALGALPRVSLSVGGLALADYRFRHVGRLDLASLRARYRASNAILVGLVVGICLVVLWTGIALLDTGEPWDRALAVLLAVALVLRSRLFSRTQHMLVLRLAGLGVLLVAALRLADQERDLLPWLVAFLALLLAAGIGLSSLPLSGISRARLKRTLNVVEFLVVVVLLVVAVGALGVYDLLGGMFG
jgi:type VII secretion integral membrane protein EccD